VQGLWLALLLSALGIPILAFPGAWLSRLGAAPEVEALVTSYLRFHSLALPAALLFRATYAFNVAVSRPKVMMAVQAAGLLLKVALNYALIFGHFGLPRLGAVGCGLASLVTHWALFLMGWTFTRLDTAYGRYAIRRTRPHWAALREHLSLGIPIGLAYVLESTSFSFVTLLVAGLGTSVLGGHQIVSNLAALAFQVPLALSLATATFTAQALGAGDAGRARRAAFTGIRLTVGAASATAATFWLCRRGLVGLYTTDQAVAAVALSLIGYMAGFHVFDALQAVAAFVLRAHRIVLVPTVIYAVVLWGLGLSGGYVMAFQPVLGGPRGAAGLWLAQVVALCLTSALLLGCYLWVLGRRRSVTGAGPS
jgi:MATE family multidrug resistance protein